MRTALAGLAAALVLACASREEKHFLMGIVPPEAGAAAAAALSTPIEAPRQRKAPIITSMITKMEPEAERFLRSIMLFEPGAAVYIATTTEGAQEIRGLFPELNFKPQLFLDGYVGPDRNIVREELQQSGMWTKFQMEKAHILRTALEAESPGGDGAWFLDGDTFLLAPLPHVEGPVGLKHHRISDYMEKAYGKYNGGFLFFRSTDALRIWEEAAPLAREECCQDQTALDDVAERTAFSELGCGSGIGWFQMTDAPFNDRLSYDDVKCNDGQVQFKDCTILSLHFHIDDKFGRPLRAPLEKAVRECGHPVLALLAESYKSLHA